MDQEQLLSRPIRILLVDDSDAIRRLISNHLVRAGAEVATAEDGCQALQAVQNCSREGLGFDVILMDMQMPKLDGANTVIALRALGYKGKILALTADEDSYVVNKCLEVGCNRYATKPITPQSLVSLIQESLTEAS